MALNRTNERLRCVLKDASLNNRMACIALESAARQLEDPQLAEVLVKTARTLSADAHHLHRHAREVERGRIRRKR